MLTRWRSLCLACLLWLAPAQSVAQPLAENCPQASLFLRAPEATIRPGEADEPLKVELTAVIAIDRRGSAEAVGASPLQLCGITAAGLEVNDEYLCSAFGRYFGERDQIKSNAKRLSFSIHGELSEASGSVGVKRHRPEDCAPETNVVVIAPSQGRLTAVSGPARNLSSTSVTWSTRDRQGGRSRWIAHYSYADPGGMRMSPKSWRQIESGRFLNLARMILEPTVAILAIFLGFAYFAKRLLAADPEGRPAAAVHSALRGATALLAAAYFSDLASATGRLLTPMADRYAITMGLPRIVYRAVGDWLIVHVAAGWLAILPILLTLTALLFGLVRWQRKRGLRFNIVMAAANAYLAGGWLALACGGLTIAFSLLPRAIPFEPPAIAISVAVAFWFVTSARRLLGLGRGTAALLALALAATLLYPQYPVATAPDFLPPAAANGFYWFIFLCEFLADAGLLLLCLVLAIRVAANPESADGDAAGESLFLFSLSIALFGVVDIIDAAAFLLFVLMVRRIAASPVAAPQQLLPQEARRIALVAGAIAAAVLWVQLATRDASPVEENRFLFDIYAMFRAGIPASIGALILVRLHDNFPGRMAVGTAVVLTAIGLGATLAGRAEYAIEHRSVLPALVDMIGLATALLMIALFRYDLPRTRVELQGGTFREKIGGSGLAWLATTLGALVAAIASAVSPIVFEELGKKVAAVAVEQFPAQRGQAGGAEDTR